MPTRLNFLLPVLYFLLTVRTLISPLFTLYINLMLQEPAINNCSSLTLSERFMNDVSWCLSMDLYVFYLYVILLYLEFMSYTFFIWNSFHFTLSSFFYYLSCCKDHERNISRDPILTSCLVLYLDLSLYFLVTLDLGTQMWQVYL